tara:strand:+ start:2991 stop:3515 length:525 start_codon:yes stop_codon:yes gene_type:complete
MNSEKYIKSREFFNNNDIGIKNKHHPIVVCWKLNNPSNLGSILRVSDNMACEKVLFIDDNPSFRKAKIKQTAQSSFNTVKWLFCDSKTWIDNIPEDYHIIAVETTSSAKNLYETSLPEKCALILGNEKVGIDIEILKKCNKTIFIPMKGSNKSMNVGHALTVVLGEWIRQNYYF